MRLPLVVLLLLLALVAPACALENDAPEKGSPADARPNVVLVLVDDMRTDELAFMDDTMRLMGDGGTWFPNAISPHPLCCPARAELISGQYAQNNGVQHNSGPYGTITALDDHEQTLPVWLHDGGYQTAYVGKYLNKYGTSIYPASAEPGWDRWEPLVGSVSGYTRFKFYGDRTTTTGYIADAVEQRTVDAIEDFAGDGRPFFVYANHTAPHAAQGYGNDGLPIPEERYRDHPVPLRLLDFLDNPAFNEKDVGDLPRRLRKAPVSVKRMVAEARARIRTLQSVDDYMETLFATLEATGELDDTYVVFASDNGYLLGEHRLQKKNQLFREALDVPVLVRGPGVGAGVQDGTAVSLVDLPATLLDIADEEPGTTIDGTSFLPLLDGGSLQWRDTTLVQTGRESTRGEFPGWQYRGVQTARYLYVVDVNSDGSNADYLFDRRRNPFELRNVVSDRRYAEVVAELERRRQVLESCAGPVCNQQLGPVPLPD